MSAKVNYWIFFSGASIIRTSPRGCGTEAAGTIEYRTMQRWLDYYFGKKSYDPVLDDDPSRKTAGLQPTINLVISVKRKKALGRPQKSNEPPRAKKALVDYSSSQEEAESTTNFTGKKRMHRMYSQGQKRRLLIMSDTMAFVKQLGTSECTIEMYNDGWKVKFLQKSKEVSKQGQGRKITYPQELEDKLVAWILEECEAVCGKWFAWKHCL